jgi:glycosyltransferase involved in cell wall biosynthesis
MRKLLWIGDAAVASGFARATHYTLDVLRKTWDVSVLGLNYQGDPHDYPYPIYPCWPGGDLFGLGRMPRLISKLRPDVVVVQNDPWNIPEYLTKAGNAPVVASLAVDGKNCRGRGLNGLALAIFWTKFGEQEARLGGYTGPSAVVPLGVDLDIYKPLPQLAARQRIGWPEELGKAFIVGNVNRNQPRKRLDLTIMYFAEWIKRERVDDAYLFLHVAPTGETGYDVKQLAQYCGISNRILCVTPEMGQGIKEDLLTATYNCFDVLLTTTQGEGFGLTTFEAMACGVVPIVPDWAALGELVEDAAIKVPCTTVACTPNTINAIGGVPDREGTIQALNTLYRDARLRGELRERGLALVARDRYRWPNIGEAFGAAVDEALYLQKAEVAV